VEEDEKSGDMPLALIEADGDVIEQGDEPEADDIRTLDGTDEMTIDIHQ
jgi:hypothetical protein